MYWLILVGVLCVLIYYKLNQSLSYWKERGVVHKNASFAIGSSFKILFQKTSMFEHVLNMCRDFSDQRYFGGHQFLRPILFVKDLDLIKRITVKDFEFFMDHNNVITEDVEPLMARNLFNLKGQRWRDMRSALSPSFTTNKMKMIFNLVSECAEAFTKHFEKQTEQVIDVEMKDVFTRFTNDAIASVAFGYKCNSLEDKDNDFYLMGKKATRFSGYTFIAFMMHATFPQLAKIVKLRLFPEQVSSFFRRLIKDNIRKREQEGLIRPDMIHLLLEARKGTLQCDDSNSNETESDVSTVRPKIEISDEDITAQALIFFFGGFETSSVLMSFIAYELAMNTDVQKRLQKEIDETLKKYDGKLTYDSVNEMTYMDMVVSESLRKWPPGFFIERMCVKDYMIEPVNAWEKPLLIEKGLIVQIPVISNHRDPKYFPDPEKFDPERFNEHNKHKIEPIAFLPFGWGPRICIASRFALIENKIIIFNLLSKFDLVRTVKTPYPLKITPNSLNLAAAGGFWLGLKKRESV